MDADNEDSNNKNETKFINIFARINESIARAGNNVSEKSMKALEKWLRKSERDLTLRNSMNAESRDTLQSISSNLRDSLKRIKDNKKSTVTTESPASNAIRNDYIAANNDSGSLLNISIL